MPIKFVPQNHPLFPTRASHFPKRKHMQKVDAVIDLRLEDPVIDRDAKTHDMLRVAMRNATLRPSGRKPLFRLPTLYRRYRGTSFPLRKPNGQRVQLWRHLSPWMKTQIASLCLMERRMMVFRAHLHDDVMAQMKGCNANGLREYFRDRIGRCLRAAYGEVPFFWFVIENRTATGASATRPHIHGEIEIQRAALPIMRHGLTSIQSRRIIHTSGIEEAELAHGREITHDAILRATGNERTSRRDVNGRDQRRNIWWRKPYRQISNQDWISYAFKNTKRVSRALGPQRLVTSRELSKEAQRLWKLVRIGEDAMDQWM